MKTVLITGCSSGYGLATPATFTRKGGTIVTMRTPREKFCLGRTGCGWRRSM